MVSKRAHIEYAPPVAPREFTVREIEEPAPEFDMEVLVIAVGVPEHDVAMMNADESPLTPGIEVPLTVTI